VRVSDQRDRMRASLLEEWPDEVVPRWWVQDEAEKRGLVYGELWHAVHLLGFRVLLALGSWDDIERLHGHGVIAKLPVASPKGGH
jgi:hypothetical protein